MTILVTGSLGKTGGPLARILTSEGHKVLVASRSGKAADYPAVKFDWSEPSTWKAVFESPEAKSSPITAVYLVVLLDYPGVEKVVEDFIGLARSHGVKRFVFLGASLVDEHGSDWRSLVHTFLKESGVEWAVLRATWFMQNFSESPLHPIKTNDTIISATGDGAIPFVNTEDIAAVAAKALTSEKPLNRDVLVLGPELLTYADVASLLSSATGRQIKHKRVTPDEYRQMLLGFGLPDHISTLLAKMEGEVAKGADARLTDDVATIIGRQPSTFKAFAETNKAAFEKK